MADINISLSTIRNTRTIDLGDDGVITIRKLGAGEDLDLSVKRRQLGKIIDQLQKIDFTKFDVNNPEDLKEMEVQEKKFDQLTEEYANIKQFEFNTYKNCLSDDEGGKIVDLVMNTLTEKERAELFRRAFGEEIIIDNPDVIKPEDESGSKDE